MLSDLEVNDDLDISIDPDQYVDQAAPAPPLPGTYRFQVVGELKKRTNQAGEVVLADGKYETYVIQRAKIVEPDELKKEFGLFQDIRTKPFERQGTPASDVADICRGIDQTARPETFNTVGWVNLLKELVQGGGQFNAELDWEAYDADFVSQEFERLGVTKSNAKEKLTKDVYNGIFKKARLNAFAFKPNGQGGRLTFAQGPSGATLEARAKIRRYIPSLQAVNLGQKKVK